MRDPARSQKARRLKITLDSDLVRLQKASNKRTKGVSGQHRVNPALYCIKEIDICDR